MNIRKFLHHFGMHSIYWSSITDEFVEKRCRYCDWKERMIRP